LIQFYPSVNLKLTMKIKNGYKMILISKRADLINIVVAFSRHNNIQNYKN